MRSIFSVLFSFFLCFAIFLSAVLTVCVFPFSKEETSDESVFVPMVKNYTKSESDITEALNGTALPKGIVSSDITVLICHTHGTEGYRGSEDTEYRTEDTAENVVAVGSALSAELQRLGVNVYHDRTMYDRESYSDAYALCREGILNICSEHPTVKYIIDIHRDSVTEDGEEVHIAYNIDGIDYAPVGAVVGTGEESDDSEWIFNFTNAVQLSLAIGEKSASLVKPILVKSKSYNHDISRGAMLLEVGSAGNTLDEAKASAKLIAEALVKIFS